MTWEAGTIAWFFCAAVLLTRNKVLPLPLREGSGGGVRARTEPLPPTPSLKGRGSLLGTTPSAVSFGVGPPLLAGGQLVMTRAA